MNLVARSATQDVARFYGTRRFIAVSQEPATGPYLQPENSGEADRNMKLKAHFCLNSRLKTLPPYDLFVAHAQWRVCLCPSDT
jgi:hypothetical protein